MKAHHPENNDQVYIVEHLNNMLNMLTGEMGIDMLIFEKYAANYKFANKFKK